jgi:hypothetical protein
MALAGAIVADNENALVVRRLEELQIREDEMGQLVGHPIRDDESLDELTGMGMLGRFRLPELDDGLDRLKTHKFPILHGEAHSIGLPIIMKRDC